MLEIKNTVRKMKNTFDGLFSRYGVAEERISKFDDRLIVMETLQLKCFHYKHCNGKKKRIIIIIKKKL